MAIMAYFATGTVSNGYNLAWAVMVILALALLYSAVIIIRSSLGKITPQLPSWLDAAVPVLNIIGLGVAGYLAYIEMQAIPAVCGPVGDCNAVQSSTYARLFGVLPIGVLGVAGYLAIVAAWLWAHFRTDWLADLAPLALFGMTLFGTIFSIYLTYLELFVIHAVCIWCLSNAVIMAVLLILAATSAMYAENTEEEKP
jgi:uncharacterized membrane protein